jgi:diacylglycerol O-acyltransferase
VNNGLTRHLPLGISSVVSNVAGPNFPLYSAGAQMVRYYGLGLLTPGVGLFHLIFSSNGIMTMSILGDRNVMPDPAFYRECIEQSFDELLAAAKNIANTDSAAKPASAPAKRSAAKSSVAKKAASSPARSASAKKPAVTQAVKKPVARKAKSASSAKGSASAKVNGAVADDTKVVPIKNTVS